MRDDKVILLVEDNRDDEALTIRALGRSGVGNRIDVAADGIEALAYLHGSEGQAAMPLPQVVLLDLGLPRIGGLEVLRRLRAHDRTRRLPVVILTSSDDEKDVVAGYDNGTNSFVQKPVEFGAFRQAVEHLGLYWLLVNKVPD